MPIKPVTHLEKAIAGTVEPVTHLEQVISEYGGGGGGSVTAADLDDAFKDALLDCFANVAWATEDGQQYYDALEVALYPLDHITAVYTQSGTVYDTDSLDNLKADLVVTAFYQGGGSKTVTGYTLSGTLTVGTSTITVSYGGKTTTFDVAVTESLLLPTEYQQVEYIANPSDAYFVTNITVPLGYKLHAKAFWPAKGRAGQSVCGGGNNGYNRSFFFYSNSTDNVGCWYGYTDNFVQVIGYTSEPVEVQTVVTASDISVNAKNSQSDNSKTTKVVATAVPTATNPLEVFRTSAAAPGNFVGRIYFIEVLDTEDIATAKLIPCYRKADNVVGMYDVVNNAFYSSASSTAFTKGGNV